jgi:hypothetical protein
MELQCWLRLRESEEQLILIKTCQQLDAGSGNWEDEERR